MIKDLTVGPPGKALRNFSLPLLGGVIFQQMYNVADSLIAGKMIGENALSAVGNAYEVTLIYLAFAFGCNIGCSVVISQLYGAKRIRELKSAVSTNFLFSGALTLLLMVLGFLLMPSLLRLIRLADSIRPAALEYLNIYTAGLLFLFFYNISSGIFFRAGRLENPVLVPCLLVYGECVHGHSLCPPVSAPRRRRGRVGDLPVSGSELRVGGRDGVPQAAHTGM